MEEVTVVPKNLKFEIVVFQGVINEISVRKDGMHHTILRVTLLNNEQYAIDLTGAQYGYHQECLPWQTYITTRVEIIVEIQALGAAKQFLANNARDYVKNGSMAERLESIDFFFARELELCIKSWTLGHESVGSLLAAPQDEYESKKKSLLEMVTKAMEVSRANNLRDRRWCRE